MRSTLKKYLSLVKLKIVEILSRNGNVRGMDLVNLKDMNRSELESFVSSLRLEPFRGRQIFRWIFKEGADDFGIMTDLTKKLRAELKILDSKIRFIELVLSKKINLFNKSKEDMIKILEKSLIISLSIFV